MISGEELNKILRTIEICAIDYNKNEDGMESFEWSELWLLDSYINDLQQENQKSKAVIDKAVDIAWKYGQIDGDHHQKWVTDQMVRALLGSAYENFVKDYEEDGGYEWDIGIAP